MSSPPSKLGHGDEAAAGAASVTKPVKAEAGEPSSSLLSIKVTSQTADDEFFRITRKTKLRRLMDLYCGKHSLDPRTVEFLDGEGRHIRSVQTPDDAGLVDGDEISINIKMHGGAAPPAHAGRASE
ncbi:hypothetical protein ACP4OV_030011 [Aristida adscensionis]